MAPKFADDKNKDKLDILIIADHFNQNFEPWLGQTPLGLLNVGPVSLLDMTLEWVSQIDANIYVIFSKIDDKLKEGIKLKWAPYFNIEVLVFNGCHSFGEIMRALDRLHSFTKNEFILIENVPTFCSSILTQNFEAFKELRKDRIVNGKKMLGKDNLMTMVCSRSKSIQQPLILEKSTNRLLAYHPDKFINLTKKQFSTGCIFHTDLKQVGIYFCAPEIITKFTDNSDAQTFIEQIGNITAQDETICEYIHVDILPDTVFADTATDIESIYECLFGFLHHKFYPYTFNSLRPDISDWKNSYALQCRENCVFLPRDFEAPKGTRSTLFGGPFTIKEQANISGCFFGAGLQIGSNTNLSGLICGRNVKIGKNVQIKRAIINDNAVIEDNATINDCVVLQNNERIPFNSIKASESALPIRNQTQTSISDRIPEAATDNLRMFIDEIHEYIKDTLADGDWNDEQCLKDLIREINRSRFNYNIAIDEVTKHIFMEFMNQPRFGPSLDEMKTVTNGWDYLWSSYYKQPENKIQILHAIEEHTSRNHEWIKYAPKYVHFLYNDLDILTDDVIIGWYTSLDSKHVLKNDAFAQLIEWVQDAEEESDEED